MESLLYAADAVYGLLFLVAGVLAAFEPTRDHFRIARRLIIIGATIVAVRWSAWALVTDAPLTIRGAVGALIGATLFVLVPSSLHWFQARLEQGKKAEAAAGNGFFMECAQQFGPMKISPTGLYFVMISETGNNGLNHLPVTDPSQIGQDYRILNDKIIEALQCKLNNYEALLALDITFDLTVLFRKVVKQGIVVSPGDVVGQRTLQLSLSPIIGKLDPGSANSITLYIANRSQENGVTFIFPTMVSARLLNEERTRTFQLTTGGSAPILLPERPLPLLSETTSVAREQTLDIRFEPRAPYETNEISHGRGLSTVRIGLKASGKTLSNCNVYVDKIAPTPPLPGGLPILLASNAPMLRPDDPETFIDIAAHWDHANKYRFSAPVGAMFAEALGYIDDDPPRLVEIRVVARLDGSEFQKTALFKISVDQEKKLHLERQ
jgi:hypothetical protein